MNVKYQSPLDEVVAILQAECRRVFGEPLESEQVEAVFDEEQVFEMLDDMEARMGFYVADARALAAEFYSGEGA